MRRFYVCELVLLAMLLGPCADVRAQEMPVWAGDSEAIALARICRHEAGFPRRVRGLFEISDDCAAIDAVITRVRAAMEAHRARPVAYAEAVHAYSRGRIYDRARTDDACDVAWLRDDDSEPACWRAGVPWSRRVDAWRELRVHASRIRGGLVAHRCAVPPLHWGCGRFPPDHPRARAGQWRCRDHERAARAGWVEVSCGRTANAFFVAP